MGKLLESWAIQDVRRLLDRIYSPVEADQRLPETGSLKKLYVHLVERITL